MKSLADLTKDLDNPLWETIETNVATVSQARRLWGHGTASVRACRPLTGGGHHMWPCHPADLEKLLEEGYRLEAKLFAGMLVFRAQER